MSTILQFSDWLEKRDQDLHENWKNWVAGLGTGAALAAGATGLLPTKQNQQMTASKEISNLSMTIEREQDQNGKTYLWSFTFKNAPSAKIALENAKREVRDELIRMYGSKSDLSGITAAVQSDDGKGNIVVDVGKHDVRSVRASMQD